MNINKVNQFQALDITANSTDAQSAKGKQTSKNVFIIFFANDKQKVINEHERTMLSTMRTIELHCINAETKGIGSTSKISAVSVTSCET
jgi:hypothetical protein